MYMNEAIARINSIKWEAVGTNTTRIQVNFGYEFLRRLAKFYREESIRPFPPLFSNIAKLLGDTEGEILISDYCTPEVVQFLGENIYTKNIIQYYIQLARYADQNSDVSKYLSVYDPLIRIFETGGMFILRINALDIEKVAHFPLHGWYKGFKEKEPRDIDEL